MHTRCSVHSDEPFPLFLEDVLTTSTVCPKNSIQAGLGGVGLPTAIKETEEGITNFGNFIAVKKHFTHTINVTNLGVIEFPIFASSDSGIHQTFDLTHWSGVSGTNVMYQGSGGIATPLVPLTELSQSGPPRAEHLLPSRPGRSHRDRGHQSPTAATAEIQRRQCRYTHWQDWTDKIQSPDHFPLECEQLHSIAQR